MRERRLSAPRAFTLLELMLAAAAAAVIFAAILGVFSRALHLRRDAAERTRQTQLRARALTVLRQDLRGGYVSGGLVATALLGARTAPSSRFPGYLRLSTTSSRPSTGTSAPASGGTTDLPHSEVQEVEYYIAATEQGRPDAGTLVRVALPDPLTDLLPGKQETLLPDVAAMEVSFYDGSSWTETWDAAGGTAAAASAATTATGADSTAATTDTSTTTALPPVPQAVRVRVQFARAEDGTQPAPLELLVPWSQQPFISPAATTSATGT